MSAHKRLLSAAVLVAASLGLGGLAMAAEQDVEEVPVSITALDLATVRAARSAQTAPQEWLPVATGGTGAPAATAIVSVAAFSFTLDGHPVVDPAAVAVLRGPQGELFGHPDTALRNEPDPAFYGTQPAVTVVTAGITGWPPNSLQELIEMALSFNWTGDEVLEESQFPGDPLLGFGNVSSYGWVSGEPFVNYAKIQQGEWTHYTDPLLSFETTSGTGDFYIGWVIPGIPDMATINLTWSPDATPDGMVAQRVAVPIPTEIVSLPLLSDFTVLDPDLQASLGSFFATPGDGAEPATGSDADVARPGTTGRGDEAPVTDTSGDEPETGGDEGAAAPAATAGSTQGAGDEDESGGFSPVLIVVIPVVGAAVAWMLYRWWYGSRNASSPTGGAATRSDGTQPSASSGTVARADRGGGAVTPPEEPAVQSHPNPPRQLMSARDESLGLADAMVGVVVDGWHLLPWDVGSQFHLAAGGSQTERTIPVRNVDVVTDVDFLGKPPGWEPDATRFAYWLHDDGTLKIGSPTDPHAYPLDAPPDPLLAMLPPIESGDALQASLTRRVITAHQLSGGAPPVDGWIAPSKYSHGAGMLSDTFAGPDHDPDAWSGSFINVETLEWVRPSDPAYAGLADKLGVAPQPPPVESTDLFDLGDDVGSF
jgi:hypothetical protein